MHKAPIDSLARQRQLPPAGPIFLSFWQARRRRHPALLRGTAFDGVRRGDDAAFVCCGHSLPNLSLIFLRTRAGEEMGPAGYKQ